MNRLLVRGAIAVLSTAAVLGWWTLTGIRGSNKTSSIGKMPAKIFGGGGKQVIIEVDVTGPAELGFMGVLPRKPNGDQAMEEDSEPMTAGTHTWFIDLAPHTSGTFDLRALNPQVGNRMSWTVKVDGKEIAHETDTLDKPLRQNEAQGLQVRVEDEEEP
jgi:hypothetical protein